MEFDLIYCCLGNGITIANKKVMEHNDYKTIAHITDYGIITYRQNNLPQNIIADIEAMAEIQRKQTAKDTTQSILTCFKWWNYNSKKYTAKAIYDTLFNGNRNELTALKQTIYEAPKENYYIAPYDNIIKNIEKMIKE